MSGIVFRGRKKRVLYENNVKVPCSNESKHPFSTALKNDDGIGWCFCDRFFDSSACEKSFQCVSNDDGWSWEPLPAYYMIVQVHKFESYFPWHHCTVEGNIKAYSLSRK